MKNNEDRKNRKKTEEKLHISISNIEIGFLNFVRFIVFTNSCDLFSTRKVEKLDF